jgi:hypothetical protein
MLAAGMLAGLPHTFAETIRSSSQAAGKPIADSAYAESQHGAFCVSHQRRYPSGSTMACMVQPGPGTRCVGLLGLTVKLWTCRNGQWLLQQ